MRRLLLACIPIAVILAAAGGCNWQLDPEECGYDKPPGPDYSCDGDVLVTAMHCPQETRTRTNCAAQGDVCRSGGCVHLCTQNSDCLPSEYCSPWPGDEESVCEPYVQQGSACNNASQCMPGLICGVPEDGAGSPDDAGDSGGDADADVDAPEPYYGYTVYVCRAP
jgi:hypothetical protein